MQKKSHGLKGLPIHVKLGRAILKPVTLAFLLASILIGGLEYYLYTADADFRLERLKESVRQRLLSVGNTAALMLNGEKHAEIFDYRDDDLQEFQTLRQHLRDVRRVNRIEEELYTLRLKDPKERIASFVVMTNEKPYIGVDYIYPEEMHRSFILGVPSTTGIYKSKSVEGRLWMSAFVPFKEPGEDYYAVFEVDISVNNLLQENQKISQRLMFFHVLRGLILLILFVLIYATVGNVLRRVMARLLNRPLSQVIQFTDKVKQGVLEPTLAVASGDELEVLADSMNDMVKGLRQKETMSKFLTGMALKEVMAVSEEGKELSLSGEKKNIAVMFSDIRNFTTISENSDPQIIIQALNFYFSELIPLITNHGGHLDKLIGDCIMAVFEEGEGFSPADACLKATIAMHKRLNELHVEMAAMNFPRFDAGYGMNAGIGVVGNVGDSLSLSRTVLGDVVNLAARVEALSKQGKSTCILLAEDFVQQLQEEYPMEFLMETTVKGRAKPVKVFEIQDN